MNLLVAPLTDDQGLTMAHRHPLDPLRLLFPSGLTQISQLANVMHLAVQCQAAKLTFFGQQSLDQLTPQTIVNLRRTVVHHGVFLSPQLNSSEPRHQWFLLCTSWPDNFQRFEGAVRRRNHRLLLSDHLPDTAPLFVGQCLGERKFHDSV